MNQPPQPDAPTPGRISTPLTLRLRRWRLRYVPVLVWLAAVGSAVHVAQQRSQVQSPIVGMVETLEAVVASTTPGRIAAIEARLFQEVEPGDVIARMDDLLLTAELQTARAELARRRAELTAARHKLLWENDQIERSLLSTFRRLALDAEEAKLDVLDREASLEVLRVQRDGLRTRLARQEQLLRENIVNPDAYEQLEYESKGVESRIAEEETALVSARELLTNTLARREEAETTLGAQARDLDALLQPIGEAIAVQESLIAGFADRREHMILRAPIAGRVTALLAHPGQTVLAGVPVATIVAHRPERILAYIAETDLDTVQPGVEVEVSTRRLPRTTMRTRIAATSAGIEQIPERLWRHPMLPQWGLPLLLEDPPAAGLRPGELLDIRILNVAALGG